MNLSERQKQAWAGCEANIHKASFTERRLFYLNCHMQNIPLIPNPSPNEEGSPLFLWERARVRGYKGLQ